MIAPNKRKPEIIDLPKVEDARGNLSFIEGERTIPFVVTRTYWVYDVPGGQRRNGHANTTSHEFIVAISGSFDVLVDDGQCQQIFSLNRSYFGLYLPPMTWRSIQNFSTNSLCLVLSSFQATDCEMLRSYDKFLELKNG